MNNLNSVLLEGNMVRDPLLRSTPKGASVCNFTIASNRFYKQNSNFERETGFFNVEAWGKLADTCNTQGRKGRGVRIVGRLKQDRWTGVDGKNHTRIAIVAEHVEYRSDLKKDNGHSGHNSPGYGNDAVDAGSLAGEAIPGEEENKEPYGYPDMSSLEENFDDVKAVAF